MTLETTFSHDRVYRYTLWRRWFDDGLFLNRDKVRFVQFVGLNPSTADETNNDPTVTRCINYAMAWGYDAMCMTNLFAFRATDPAVMKKAAEQVGKDNDHWLFHIASKASLVIAAWGNHGEFNGRGKVVLSHFQKLGAGLHHLGLTGAGQPKHPLYLRKDLKPIPYT